MPTPFRETDLASLCRFIVGQIEHLCNKVIAITSQRVVWQFGFSYLFGASLPVLVLDWIGGDADVTKTMW
jgi:hypothetical protein